MNPASLTTKPEEAASEKESRIPELTFTDREVVEY